MQHTHWAIHTYHCNEVKIATYCTEKEDSWINLDGGKHGHGMSFMVVLGPADRHMTDLILSKQAHSSKPTVVAAVTCKGWWRDLVCILACLDCGDVLNIVLPLSKRFTEQGGSSLVRGHVRAQVSALRGRRGRQVHIARQTVASRVCAHYRTD